MQTIASIIKENSQLGGFGNRFFNPPKDDRSSILINDIKEYIQENQTENLVFCIDPDTPPVWFSAAIGCGFTFWCINMKGQLLMDGKNPRAAPAGTHSPGVSCVVYRKKTTENQEVLFDFLFVEEKTAKGGSSGRWKLVSGCVGHGVTSLTQAVDEVKEETGYNTVNAVYVGTVERPNMGRVQTSDIITCYALEAVDGFTKNPVVQKSEIARAIWMPRRDATMLAKNEVDGAIVSEFAKNMIRATLDQFGTSPTGIIECKDFINPDKDCLFLRSGKSVDMKPSYDPPPKSVEMNEYQTMLMNTKLNLTTNII